MNRRQFLKGFGVGAMLLAGRDVFAAGPAGSTNHLSKPHAAPVQKSRPPGTCGGFVDTDADGICERSVKGSRPCTAVRCPVNVGNKTKADNAPAGSCALWKDPQKKGFCAVCLDPVKPCLYTPCPTHKDHKAGAVKGTPG